MEKLLNKLKELIKEDDQIGTPTDMYSWAKQQGVLITRNDASYIVILLERLAKVANEVPGTLPIFDVSVAKRTVCDHDAVKCKFHTPETHICYYSGECEFQQTEH